MKRVCGWCKIDLGPSVATINESGEFPITHGICGDCTRKVLAFSAKPLRNFLDQFPKPVFLMDVAGRVVTGNSAAFSLLQKTPDLVEGELGGDAFDCNYAELPGGCGKTVHCKSCTIRMSITSTFESGKSAIRVPAYPDLHQLTGEDRIRYFITTERIGETVLLRIDEVARENQRQNDEPANEG